MPGGDTEVGGNGSVYWRSTHYDKNHNKRKLKVKPSGSSHNNDEIDLDKDDAFGKDDETDVSEIGARLGHKGFFLVTLRYKTMADAQAAGTWVAQNVKPASGGYFLTILVPSIKTRDNPGHDLPFEIKVEW